MLTADLQIQTGLSHSLLAGLQMVLQNTSTPSS